jgi:hypothetical protein
LEIRVNRFKDLGLNRRLENLDALRQKLVVATDRLIGFEAELLNVHVDFPLFQRQAFPVLYGRTKIPGIKIHDTRSICSLLDEHSSDRGYIGLRCYRCGY